MTLTCAVCGEPVLRGQRFCGACGRPVHGSGPTVIAGRYMIQRPIGEGSRKRVYLAHDTRLDRAVALALIKTDGLDAAGLDRVRREAQAMARLGDHPHIVTVFDIGEEHGQPYIVSQYMAGGDLATLLEAAPQRRLSVEQALRIAADVCQALAHAHAHGIIHRDLKPSNIWLAEASPAPASPDPSPGAAALGRATLGDFGLALAPDHTRLTQAGMIVGTVVYMSPEQALGREADARSDLYSLGALLYELLTGRPPFTGDDVVAVISQHVNAAPLAPSWQNPAVPPALDALILDLLAKAPAERPGTAAAVLERLRRIADERSATSAEQRATEEVRSGEGGVGPPPTHHPSPAQRAPATSRLVWGRLVGRQHELATLKAAVDGALAGRGALVMVAGEAGIGKTRLVEEAAVYARLRGMQVLWGRCYEVEAALPYIPFVEAIRQYVQIRPPEALREDLGHGATDVATLVSAVRQSLPELTAATAAEHRAANNEPRGDPAQERYRVFESVTTFLLNASRATPLMIVLDDLRWADKPSLLLLQHLARRLADGRLLLVGTYRDVEVDRQHPLTEALMRLRRERTFERIGLHGLTLEEMTALLESAAQHELRGEADQAVVRALHRHSEGNPFFAEEIVRHLVETGRVYYRDGRWTSDATSIAELDIPEGVREVLGRRLAQLSPECNRALATAAVLGREFDFAVLGAATGMDEEALLAAVEEALAARIIVDVRGRASATYAFSHALTRQALYDDLSRPRRQRLHRQAAEALEATYARDLEPHLGELAHHYFRAGPGGDPAKAVAYARRAAERALAQLAYEEAAGYYDLALHALAMQEMPDEPLRCELLLALGDMQLRAGEPLRAREAFQRAADIALQQRAASNEQRDAGEAASAAALLAHAALGYSATFEAGTADEPRIRLLEDALQVLGEVLGEEDSALRSRLLGRLAIALYYTPARERMDALSQEGVDVARRLGDPAVLAAALNARRAVLTGPSNVQERLAVSTELVQCAEATGNRERILQGLRWRIVDLVELGEMRAADAAIAAHTRLAEELRQPLYLWRSAMWRAMRAISDGRFAEGERLAQEALAAGQRAQDTFAAPPFGAQMYALRWLQGRLAEIEGAVAGFAERYPTLPSWRCGLAFIHREMDRGAEAAREFEQLAAKNFTDLYRDANWLTSLALLAHVCAFLGDRPNAGLLYDLLLPYSRHVVLVGDAVAWYGPAAHPLALLAATLGRWEEAERHFEDAAALATRMGARPFLAIVRLDEAEALLTRDRFGDRVRALPLLDEAAAIGQELGMTRVVERALAARLRAQGVPAGAVTSSIDAVAAAAQQRPPDLRPHAAPDGTVTILFTDIENSAAMTEELGDLRWLEVLRAHNAIIREQVATHGGYEVKSQGDGFMVAFASARRALHCAIAIQRAFDRTCVADAPRVRLRIGLHTGEAIREADDFFGRNVIVAARIAAKARGDEILVSAVLKELTESAGEFCFDAGRDLELKGLAGTHRVFAVTWQA